MGQTEELKELLRQNGTEIDRTGLELKNEDDGLVLTDGSMNLRCDFTHMIQRIKQGRLQSELIVRAAKIKGIEDDLTAVDATAGFGEDSLLLAAAGFSVILYEYDPVIAALLRDGLRGAADIPELSEAVGRMELREENSITALQKLNEPPDVIYLDPMFPERQKSGLIKKKFQLLQQLERPCEDEGALVHAAYDAGPRKIIIKRPLKAASLADIKPSYSIKGKSIRYDCIVIPR